MSVSAYYVGESLTHIPLNQDKDTCKFELAQQGIIILFWIKHKTMIKIRFTTINLQWWYRQLLLQPKEGKAESMYDLIDPFDFHSWFVLIELANCLNLVETNQRKYSVMMIIECGLTWPALARHEPG